MTDREYITMRLEEGPEHTPLSRQQHERRRFVAPAAVGGAALLAAVIAGTVGCNPRSAHVAAQPPAETVPAAIRDAGDCARPFLVTLPGGRPDSHALASLDLADLPKRTVA